MQETSDLRRLHPSEGQMAAYHIPGAFFLEEALLYRISPRTDLDRLSVVELADRTRAERVVRAEIARRDRLHGDVPRIVPDLRFVRYLEADSTPGYDVFICERRDCERVLRFRLEQAPQLVCPNHGAGSLQQLAHVFVHPQCGALEQITPRKCWEPAGAGQCGADLRLRIERADIGASYWWCPRCAAEHRRDRHSVFKRCPACYKAAADAAEQAKAAGAEPLDDAGDDDVRMWLVPASTAYKPQYAAALDMPQADEDATLAEWLGADAATDAQIEALIRALPGSVKDDPVLMRGLRQHVLRERGGQATPALPDDAAEQLREFAGARSARPQGLELSADEHAIASRDFGLHAHYLDGLAVLQMCLGYTLGTADASAARLMLFPLHGGRYGVLTRKQTTEGVLFLLQSEHLRRWLGADAPAGDEKALRQHLLQVPPTDRAVTRTTTLLHTLSHILIRTSERHSGVSRERLREMVLPRFAAVLLYIDGGSELGMLRTTFEASMVPWLMGARQNAQRCAYDPVCRASAIRACHACLYLSERSCNSFWNKDLDRLVLGGLDGSTAGYWS